MTDLSRKELVVVSDVLRRVQDGAQEGNHEVLREAAYFTAQPEFATALQKIDDAVMATAHNQP